jgi:DeoR/GlpR family transcriptional regulator of sugar metabolism
MCGICSEICCNACSAIDLDGDLLNFDNHEIIVGQTALKQLPHVIMVADHLKFKRTAPLKIFSLQELKKTFHRCASAWELAGRL